MEVLTRILAAGALLAATGCSFLRDPTPVEATGEQPSVHAVLVTGSDSVKLLLQRVGPPHRGSGQPVSARPITGAEVTLETGSQGVRLAESPSARCVAVSLGAANPSEAQGCYAALLPGGVRPGAAYSLRIRLPGGGTIEGQATALTALRLESHPAGTRIFVGKRTYSGNDESTHVPLRLRGAEGAPGAAVEFVPRVVYSRGQALTQFYCSVEYPRGFVFPRDPQGDLSLRLFGVTCTPRTPNGTPPDPQFRVDSVRATLRVVAFDSVYTRYVAIQEEQAVSQREATAGVTGAIGLFAAAARAESEVVLIPK
ncbi:MAG: hypothetical protein AVDCRST_MAG68-4689 [uncultured Gemmatimonadetes bacterium]|uniref:DUF4249 domain-containing protein n=1 Tax=uncultured Gemmatimonadota bacterium TaxID=203437 RepID=A0A6J4MQF7_9BACT|nr:MAG: hypothetical protein AVDCRST_MAG68-4689 [uncultured Gemmatimonadota bacterium]